MQTDAELQSLAMEFMKNSPAGEIDPRRWDIADLRPLSSDVEYVPKSELKLMFVRSLSAARACENYILTSTRSMLKLAKTEALVDPLHRVEEVANKHFYLLSDLLMGLNISDNNVQRVIPIVSLCGYPTIDPLSEFSDWYIYTNQQVALSHQAMLYRLASTYAHGLSMSPKFMTFLLDSAEEVRRSQDHLDRSFRRMPADPTLAWDSV